MIRKMIGTGIGAIILLAAIPCFSGQNMSYGRWWHNPAVSKRFNLTEDEIKQLDDTFRTSRRKMIQYKSLVESEQFELESLMESADFDKSAVIKQYKKLQQAKNKLGMERFLFLVQVRRIVGLKRFEQLMYYKKMRRQKGKFKK